MPHPLMKRCAFCFGLATAAALAAPAAQAADQLSQAAAVDESKPMDDWTDLASLLAPAEDVGAPVPLDEPNEDSVHEQKSAEALFTSAASTSSPAPRRWRPIPHGLVPVTLAERLQTLRESHNDVIEEATAMVNPANVIGAVDRIFEMRGRFPEADINEAAAAEAADAAGRATAELLLHPGVDPIDVALYTPQPEPLDNVFLGAKAAFDDNDLDRLEEIAPLLASHELRDYVELWSLMLRLKRAPDDPACNYAFQRFIELHQGQYIGERAALEYIRAAGPLLNAQTFDALYARLAWNQQEPTVAAWRAFFDLGAPDKAAPAASLAAAKALYRDAKPISSEPYRTLGDAIVQRDRSWAWDRVVLLLQKQRWTEVKRALAAVPRPELPASIAELHEILDHPIEWFNRQHNLNAIKARLGVFAALRLAQAQIDMAAALAHQCIDLRAGAFYRSLVWMHIGFSATISLNPRASEWYGRAGDALGLRPLLVVNANGLLAWQARAALRAGNWYTLNKVIDSMPDALQRSETWIYWRGRALAERGLSELAAREFKRIAGHISFYGKLACDAIKRPYAFSTTVERPSNDAVEAWDKNPSLQRARALYRMQLYIEGHREWNWAMRSLSRPADYVTLAEYAKDRLLIHRMINTSERSGNAVAIEQRYPMPLARLVERVSHAQSIPAAWIYGLIRQESRFIPTVSSSVGAQGLMQMMPATAVWIAQRLGIAGYSPKSLTDLEMNIVLGTAYLRMLYTDLDDSFVLATAAYNAGPSRARIWRMALTEPLESAVFIETIPFYETRDYVKNVLANMQTYSMRTSSPIENFTRFLGNVHPGYSSRSSLP